MDLTALNAQRTALHAVTAEYKRTGLTADLQWRVGNSGRFEIYYTNAAGWSATHFLAHKDVMAAADTTWLIDELASEGIIMHASDAERIIQQYTIATTANWHPLLPKLKRNAPVAA
jgi:hypothetical protein